MLALGLWWGQGTAAAATVAVPLPLCPPPSRGSGKGGGHRCRHVLRSSASSAGRAQALAFSAKASVSWGSVP